MNTPHTGSGLNGRHPPDDGDYDEEDDDDGFAFTNAVLAAARGEQDALLQFLRAIDRALAECPLYPELIIGSCGPPNSACPLCHPGQSY